MLPANFGNNKTSVQKEVIYCDTYETGNPCLEEQYKSRSKRLPGD